MKAGLAILLAVLLAACQPLPAGEPGPGPSAGPGTRPQVPTNAQACRAQGGSWGPQGMLQRDGCVLPLADAGKPCTDGDQCLGDCRTDERGGRPGQAVTGQCQANTSPFGCFTRVKDGRAEPTLCVD